MNTLPLRSYVLVIAEKPKAAEKIANALGKASRRRVLGVPIWTIRKAGKTYVIASAAGHLYSLYTDEKGYPVFNYRWVPRYRVDRKGKHTYRFLKVLDILFRNADEYINACDYDIEGSLIGYLIIHNMGDIEKAKRVKFSSLTKQEILKAFANLLPMDFEMIEAGYCRHVLDWMWGINISRMLMDIYSKALKLRGVLSAGRVQTPTLAYAADIILQKKLHIPIPLIYPVIWIDINGNEYRISLIDEPFKSLEEAREYIKGIRENLYAKVVDIRVKNIELQPPHPFNLTDLQSDAYKIYGFTPYKTQKLAEDLYLEALISYPRTNSQKLPQTLDNRHIIERLAENIEYRSYIEDLFKEKNGLLKPNNGAKDDPAHPAIYPTGEKISAKLSEAHIRLYDLIVRRYLATFSSSAKIQVAELTFEINKRRYSATALKILYSGWLKYYPYPVSEKIIPYEGLRRGSLVPIKRYKLTTRYTRVERSVNRYSLLKWMENVGIGTESTRAEIIELLYKRGYLIQRSKNTDISDIGMMIVNILRKYVRELISVDLTREFESYLESIKFGKNSCDDIVNEAKKMILRHITNIKTLEKNLIEEVYNYIAYNHEKNAAELPRQRCVVCNRNAVQSGFCIFHYTAFEKLKNSYEHWKRLGYSWNNYIEKLLKLHNTGIHIKEVCKYLLIKNQ
ncbi:MAG: DNA topoisomerase I [Ignisphaera sp.]|nr:DNA topoisomerase I [Ignisphaera sp.]MCX8168152.1 DNA topoisomerase I [Ignisphaera sp.]MDW8085208.1 DNA topoisomerase I [Ignisphaera sp.]